METEGKFGLKPSAYYIYNNWMNGNIKEAKEEVYKYSKKDIVKIISELVFSDLRPSEVKGLIKFLAK